MDIGCLNNDAVCMQDQNENNGNIALTAMKPDNGARSMSATGFKVCDQMIAAYRLLLAQGPSPQIQQRRSEIIDCAGHRHGCPQSSACRNAIQEIELTELDDWSALQQIDAKDPIATAYPADPADTLMTFRDDLGNSVQAEPLNLAYLHRYEAPAVIELLHLWKSTPNLRFEDLNFEQISRSWVHQWLHVIHFDPCKIALYRRFAPGMVRYLGADFTGNSIVNVGAPALVDFYRHLQEDLCTNGRPIYTRLTRKLNGLSTIAEARIRRLDLPLYSGSEITGSLIVSVPE